MRANGEITALIEVAPAVGCLSFRVIYEVWGEDAVNRVWKAFSDKEEIDLRIGL